MSGAASLCAAMALDATLGDPQSLPHPVSVIAKFASLCERMARIAERPSSHQRFAGILTWVGVVGYTAFGTWVLERCARRSHVWLAHFVEIILLASTLSFRSLLDHIMAVVRALEEYDIEGARSALAHIVGRDTADLNVPEICRAAIETLAESTCDGIVAPLMYAVLGGPVVAMSYKAVNTLDSLFGHIEAPYRYFGWCSARADDLANFLPARISAFAIIAASEALESSGRNALDTYRSDRYRHRSPNAGQCEAAMAGALQVRLGGTNTYDGATVFTPHLGAQFASPCLEDVHRALRIVIGATILCYGAALVVSALVRQG